MLDVRHLDSSQRFSDLPPEMVLFGKSLAMRELKQKLVRICSSSIAVLLQGEVGVGKSVLSRFIYKHSSWPRGPYIRVNCPGLRGSLDYLDLCALPKLNRNVRSRGGIGENGTPHSGTLFFDQVTELNPQLQYQVWNALAERDVATMPNERSWERQVRIISASTRNLRQQVKLGRFRRELFYRLAEVTLDVPALRNRAEDLPELIEFFRLRYTSRLHAPNRPFPADLLSRASSYRWPGNIRELKNFVYRCVLLGCDRCNPGDSPRAVKCRREFENGSRPSSGIDTNPNN
jgi:DNA-binding NtrC family response regulator